jgi:hypothetical protein
MHSTQNQEAIGERTPPQTLRELSSLSMKLTRLVARNPYADPELLRELAHNSDDSIRQAITSNPNTPTDMLWKLGEEFPENLLENSVLPLLRLEKLNLVEEIPLPTLRNILKVEMVPVYFLEQAAALSDTEVLFAIAKNAQTPLTVLNQLLHKPNIYLSVKEALQLHVSLAGEMDQGWDETALTTIPPIGTNIAELDRLKVCAYIGIIPELLITHWQRKGLIREKEVLLSVAYSVNTLPSILNMLEFDVDIDICNALIANPKIPLELRAKLPKHKFSDYESDFSNFSSSQADFSNLDTPNVNLPITFLERLLGNHAISHKIVPHYLLQKPDGLPIVLANYAKSHSPLIRLIALLHPQTPGKVLAEKGRSFLWIERYAVAKNPNTPARIRECLTQDGNRVVRATARESLSE